MYMAKIGLASDKSAGKLSLHEVQSKPQLIQLETSDTLKRVLIKIKQNEGQEKKHLAHNSLISRSLYYEYKTETNGFGNYTKGLKCQSRDEVLEKGKRKRQLSEH